jgi:hypothetical protein
MHLSSLLINVRKGARARNGEVVKRVLRENEWQEWEVEKRYEAVYQKIKKFGINWQEREAELSNEDFLKWVEEWPSIHP